MADHQAVEVDRVDDDGVTPGLAIERYTAGPEGGPQQARVVVATVQEGTLREIDTAAERVREADDPNLVATVVAPRLADAEVEA